MPSSPVITRSVARQFSSLPGPNPNVPRPCLCLILIMLSCRAIAEEMKQYMESASYRDTEQNRTLEMDLGPATQGEVSSWMTAAWRRIPCPPQQMQRLIVHCNGAAQAVMPALNLFLHCGISMDRRHPLQEHLGLNEFTINVLSTRALAVPDQTPGFEPVDEQARCKPEFEYVHTVLSNYHPIGKLSGYLRKVYISGREENAEFEVVHLFKPGFNYFSWGVNEGI